MDRQEDESVCATNQTDHENLLDAAACVISGRIVKNTTEQLIEYDRSCLDGTDVTKSVQHDKIRGGLLEISHILDDAVKLVSPDELKMAGKAMQDFYAGVSKANNGLMSLVKLLEIPETRNAQSSSSNESPFFNVNMPVIPISNFTVPELLRMEEEVIKNRSKDD